MRRTNGIFDDQRPGNLFRSGKNVTESTPAQGRIIWLDSTSTTARWPKKELLKKFDEDLNTTLIFMAPSRGYSRTCTDSGRSLVYSLHSLPHLPLGSTPDSSPIQSTRSPPFSAYKLLDNFTPGKNVPTLSQWIGPPRPMVQVQAIHFGGLTTSLFSAFLAVFGKRWLNFYASADTRGSAIERSHNGQRKLSGIVGWYFDHATESPPLRLQAAFLPLGCGLSRYLWGSISPLNRWSLV